MRYKIKFTAVIVYGLFFFGCSKNEKDYQAESASLNLVNAAANLGEVEVNFTTSSSHGGAEFYSQITQTVGYGTNYNYPILAGKNVPISIVSTADTINSIISTEVNLPSASQYSMYLIGTTSSIDTLFLQDPYLKHSDSTCGIRFINLSPNSLPINITLASSDSIAEFSNLAYKHITDYKTYPSIFAIPSYKFHIWNAANDSLLTSYTLNTPYFRNVTLALIGLQGIGSSPAFNVAIVNNY